MTKSHDGGEVGVEYSGVGHPPDYRGLCPIVPGHGDGEVVVLGGHTTPEPLLGGHDQVVKEPIEDEGWGHCQSGKTHVEAILLDLDDVGVDCVNQAAVFSIVDHVLPPDVGRIGPGQVTPEAPGLDAVSLTVPGRVGAYQGIAAKQIL